MKFFSTLSASVAGILFAFFSGAAFAETGHQLPTQSTEGSSYSIKYDDWNFILKQTVLMTGNSNRRPVSRASYKNSATKIKRGNRRATGLEGNRVLFHEFRDNHQKLLLNIRRDLENVPNMLPLEKFSRNEQLAYWLNLHNVAVMLEVASAYPITSIKPLMVGSRDIWAKKSMSVAGVAISISDIEKHIITNWNNPLVLYGFYLGAVGGPNIRDEAYTAEKLTRQLTDNAREFANSLRGIRFWNDGARVSPHYKLGARYFPDFDKDIKAHLRQFMSDSLRGKLSDVKKVSFQQFDWGIADLKNGQSYNGSSHYTNPGALTHFIESPAVPQGNPNATMTNPGITIYNTETDPGNQYRGLPPHVVALVKGIQKRNRKRLGEGTVTIEELIVGEGSRIQQK